MDKITRLLLLYSKLTKGEKINKTIYLYIGYCWIVYYLVFKKDICDYKKIFAMDAKYNGGKRRDCNCSN